MTKSFDVFDTRNQLAFVTHQLLGHTYIQFHQVNFEEPDLFLEQKTPH